MKRILLLPLIFLIVSGEIPSAEYRGQARETTAGLIQQLQSVNPTQRAGAFMNLAKRDSLGAAGMPDVLLNLLDRENQLIAATLRESQGRDGISVKFGESFGEYYAQLLDACHERCAKQDPRTIQVLVNSAYGPGSPFVQKLIMEYGRKVLPLIIQKAHSDVPNVRDEALLTLGTYVASVPGLSASDLTDVRSGVISATADSDVGVRAVAVQVLGNIGDLRDVELLERIAKLDTGSEINQGKLTYPVRDGAQKAVSRIRQRGK